ncbi:YwqI/YxiC family protein [Bacillus licheniformis]|uniref:YwqI/YxiC family protein n=1 Tax=Bacillus licheniformis TaxID=1402 RepID=UPI002ED96194
MDQEIKVNTGEVKQALSKLKHSSHSMKATIPTDIKGQNHLDATKKIEELNQTINKIASSYASAFSKQVVQTESAVEAMMDTDKQLASLMKTK